jgi:hypothetical protein
VSSQLWKKPAKKNTLAGDPGDLSSMRETPPWVISCIVHVALLLILYSLTMSGFGDRDQIIDSAITEELEVLPEDFKFDPRITDELGADSQLNTLSPSKAAATEAGRDPQKDVVQLVETTRSPCKSR